MTCCSDWAQKQANWYIDPSNSTGTASDDNVGNDPAFPVLSYNGGVVAKWGTRAPTLRQNTTITWMSSQPNDGKDPVILEPVIVNAILMVVGVLPTPTLSGTFGPGQVAGKNRALPTTLRIAPIPACSVGQLVKNTTVGKESFAFVWNDQGGGIFGMCQPFTPITLPQPEWAIPTTINTWASGDTYEIYDLLSIDLVRVRPITTLMIAPNFEPPVQFQFLHFEPSDGVNPDSNVTIGPDVQFFNCSSDKVIIDGEASDDLLRTMTNCGWYAGTYGVMTNASTYFFGGCIVQSEIGGNASWSFDFDAIIDNSPTGQPFVVGNVGVETGFQLPGFGLAYIAGPIDIAGCLAVYNGGMPSGQSICWGTGVLNVTGTARLLYNPTATAVSTFLNTGGLQINAAASANPISPSAGTMQPAIALTPAALDAAYGVAGFGGLAWNPGGGSIVGKPAV